ncbi:electron transporter [Sphingomonas sp. Leaf412]|uniref:SCO family protein n=1 Tax=Sphingomonas sp. Leaf412 TaxID=1736370 RepID=UPI0006F8FB6D|nr:SCO family protein [Sphingomonas sp. Leaf412]KQT35062.1 electron transporter [Sphingomonas sp. Leaf412]
MNNRPFPLAAALLALAACSAQPAASPPLQGARIGGPIALIDQNGRAFGDAQLAGKYRIVYFGYTFCPDVCPVDVQNISAAMKVLEQRDAALAARIVPVFITVDPARDTPAVLRQFAGNFHPRLVALTGTPAQTAAIAKAFGIYFARGRGNGNGYLMDHGRQIYLMDPQGKPLALLPETPPAAIADEIVKWAR